MLLPLYEIARMCGGNIKCCVPLSGIKKEIYNEYKLSDRPVRFKFAI
jgi:hypothetical protein